MYITIPEKKGRKPRPAPVAPEQMWPHNFWPSQMTQISRDYADIRKRMNQYGLDEPTRKSRQPVDWEPYSMTYTTRPRKGTDFDRKSTSAQSNSPKYNVFLTTYSTSFAT
mmetsp:Transcript_19379/g.31755  ORF Transcript_19379/g.31755 Transcript_19379/m.31755 type:complete len:110 (-) Transcript_19379:266-595(-)